MSRPQGWRKKFRARPYTIKERSALKIAKQNRRKINQITELHHSDMNLDLTTMSTAGEVIYLSPITQGDEVEHRSGNKVTTKFVKFTFWNTGDIASKMVRMIIFRDMQCQGALPGVTDVLTSADIRAYYNWNNRARFRILRDRTYNLTTTDADVEARKLVTYTSRKNMAIEFITTAGAIAAAGKGSIFVLVISLVNGTADKWYVGSEITFLP